MASGNSLGAFFPADNEAPATSYATIGIRNGHPKLEFDDTTQEIAIFTGLLPRHYSAGGITLSIHAMMASATSGTVSWDVAFERMAGSGGAALTSDAFGAAQSVAAVTVPATAGVAFISTVTIAHGANTGNIVAGDSYRLRLRRVIGGAAAGDAEMLAIEVRET